MFHFFDHAPFDQSEHGGDLKSVLISIQRFRQPRCTKTEQIRPPVELIVKFAAISLDAVFYNISADRLELVQICTRLRQGEINFNLQN